MLAMKQLTILIDSTLFCGIGLNDRFQFRQNISAYAVCQDDRRRGMQELVGTQFDRHQADIATLSQVPCQYFQVQFFIGI